MHVNVLVLWLSCSSSIQHEAGSVLCRLCEILSCSAGIQHEARSVFCQRCEILVEWCEQLKLMISVGLGDICRFKSISAGAGCGRKIVW